MASLPPAHYPMASKPKSILELISPSFLFLSFFCVLLQGYRPPDPHPSFRTSEYQEHV